MHPARLEMLAHRLAPAIKVEKIERRADGVFIGLECGHNKMWAPHAGTMGLTHVRCAECGKGVVRLHPEYRSEFEEGGSNV